MYKIIAVCFTVMLLSSCGNLLLALIAQPETEEIDPSRIKTVLTIERYDGINCSIDGSQVTRWSSVVGTQRVSHEINTREVLKTRVIAWPELEYKDRNVYYILYNPDTSTRISLGSSDARPDGVLIEMEKTSLTLILSLDPH
ncbi:hypothetical protein [Spirochaeta dissipatitropha]